MSKLRVLSRSRLSVLAPLPAAAALTLAACGDPGPTSNSQTIAYASNASALYIADPDTNSVVTLHLDRPRSNTDSFEVGGEPTRIARAGHRLFVTLRAERAVAVLSDETGSLQMIGKISVGAEPYGVVVNEEGSRVYVASSLSGTVEELDAGRMTVLRSWRVDGEPRWLALDPSGSHLYAASVRGALITHIDLGENTVASAKLEPVNGFNSFTTTTLTPRITGDIAIVPSGGNLIVPVLFVDNNTVVFEVDRSAGVVVGGGGGGGPGGGYDSGAQQVDGTPSTGRFQPAVAIVPVIDTQPQVASVKLLDAGLHVEARGYLSSVAVSPDGELIVATVEGGGAVIAVPMNPPEVHRDRGLAGTLFGIGGGSSRSFEGSPGGLLLRANNAVQTQAGPRGVVFADGDRVLVYSFLDRAVRGIPVAMLKNIQPGLTVDGNFEDYLLPRTPLPDDIELGRRLFYSADDSLMSSRGSGVSCATCHFDGRNDGLTWSFDRGPRQTPSLAGKISLTAPVRWEGDRASIAEDAMSTSQNLMGGQGMNLTEAQAIEAFIDASRDVDVPLRGSFDPAVLRGRDLFQRTDVACASCHSGERATDNKVHTLFGMEVKTRSLVGVSSTPPYFHDGSAPTLRSLLLMSRSNGMGDTSMLSESELSDLEMYLRAL